MEMGRGCPKPPNTWREVGDFFPLPVLLLATDSLSDLFINFKINVMLRGNLTRVCLDETKPANQVALRRGRACGPVSGPQQPV